MDKKVFVDMGKNLLKEVSEKLIQQGKETFSSAKNEIIEHGKEIVETTVNEKLSELTDGFFGDKKNGKLTSSISEQDSKKDILDNELEAATPIAAEEPMKAQQITGEEKYHDA